MRVTIELYRDSDDLFRWRMRAGNGSIIATPGEGYATKASAKRAATTVESFINSDVAVAALVDRT